MRIAIVSLDFAPQIGGVQSYLYEMAHRLGETHEVVAITPAPGPLPPGASFEKRVVGSGSAVHFLVALHAWKPEVVLVGHAHPRLLLAATCYRPSKYAAIAHGNDYLAAQQRWHRPFFNVLLRRASPLVTTAGPGARELGELGLPAVVIHPGVDPERFFPAPRGDVSPGCRLLTVGRLVPRKGIDTVLHGLAMLTSQFPRLRYEVVGDGPDRGRLEQLCDSLRLRREVTFRGAVSREDLPGYYRNADIFVMPARREPDAASIEGFGIVYLEASASGLPTVAARSGGAAEAVKDGETGLLVPAEDPSAFSEAVRRLMQDHELRTRLGEIGRHWAETTMSWDRAARELEGQLLA